MKCHIAEESEWEEWDKFNSEHGNVFQSKDMALAYKGSGMEVELILTKDNGEIIGGTYYMIPKVKFNWFFNQLRVVSGPVLKELNKECLALILDKLLEVAKQKKAIVIPLRTQFIGLDEVFTSKGFVKSEYAPTHSYCNNLTAGTDELWKKLSKTQRKKVNRCKKEGVVIEEITSLDELKEFNKVYQQFASSRKGWIPVPYELFEAIYKDMHEKSKFHVAKYQGKIIAVGLFLLFNDKIIYLANGSDESYKDLSANSLLIWNIMEWGAKNRYSLLDIYGVFPQPKEDDKFAQGMNFFKSQFGGTLEEIFMYFNNDLAKFRLFLFKKIIIPFVLPVYKLMKR